MLLHSTAAQRLDSREVQASNQWWTAGLVVETLSMVPHNRGIAGTLLEKLRARSHLDGLSLDIVCLKQRVVLVMKTYSTI